MTLKFEICKYNSTKNVYDGTVILPKDMGIAHLIAIYNSSILVKG